MQTSRESYLENEHLIIIAKGVIILLNCMPVDKKEEQKRREYDID